MIGVVDTGGANLTSLFAAIERLGHTPRLVRSPRSLGRATRVLLPGVGAAGDSMARLRKNGLASAIPKLTQPVLGICLGMQLLFEYSDEDDAECLGILPGGSTSLQSGGTLPVPHMGWSRLNWARHCPLADGLGSDEYFYFVHSFAVPPSETTIADAKHGRAFAAVCGRDNFYGTQFHPERSGRPGSRLLANFLAQ